MDFAVRVDYKVELKENKTRDKYLDLAREQNTMKHETGVDTNYNWCSQYINQRIGTGQGDLENKKTSRDHPNYSI